jgi:hypothetical protein
VGMGVPKDTMVSPTNNSSEQSLRRGVVFPKVTQGFRENWRAELFGQVLSLANTTQRQGISAIKTISRTFISTNWPLG